MAAAGLCHAVPALAATSDKARQLVRQAANAAVHKDYRQSSALLFKARSEAEAPDADGVLLLSGGAGITPGRFVTARITGAETYDVTGVIV